VAAQFEISLDTVRYLAQHYGSSFHAALRRDAETHAEAETAGHRPAIKIASGPESSALVSVTRPATAT
jgi:hypothetical protein